MTAAARRRHATITQPERAYRLVAVGNYTVGAGVVRIGPVETARALQTVEVTGADVSTLQGNPDVDSQIPQFFCARWGRHSRNLLTICELRRSYFFDFATPDFSAVAVFVAAVLSRSAFAVTAR